MTMTDLLKRIAVVVIAILFGVACGYKLAYSRYYMARYDEGYAHALETVAVPIEVKQDAVQVATAVQTTTQTVVRPKKSADEPSVVVKTEPPKIVASVNGKKYDFDSTTHQLGTTVTTTGVVNIRIPERRWTAGIGYGKDKKVSYMLKAPIGKSSALGVWVAGSGKSNFMGGLSVSF